MTNRLQGSIGYLAGAMDRLECRGAAWRRNMTDFLWNLNTGSFNPCDKPMDWGIENEDSRQWRIEALKTAGKLYDEEHFHESFKICEAVHAQMRDIVASDFRGVDKADFVILNIDLEVHACGSYNEQTTACLQRKPVIVRCEQGKFNVPHWLWGICQHEMFFSTWNEVKAYIEHIAFDDNINHLKRWRFFDFKKIYGRNVFSLDKGV